MRIKAAATENWKMQLSEVIVLTGSSKQPTPMIKQRYRPTNDWNNATLQLGAFVEWESKIAFITLAISLL